MLGVRIGEAKRPGPSDTCCFDDSDGDDWLLEGPPDLLDVTPWDAPPDLPTLCDDVHEYMDPMQALVPTWMEDSYFDELLLAEWREAERAGGVTTAAAPKARATTEPIAMPLDSATAFVASKAFLGQWPGWKFGTGDEGTGYHRDSTLPAKQDGIKGQISLEEAIPITACTRSLLAAGNPQRTSRPKRREATRARHPDGSRKKILSRRRWATASLPGSSTRDDICHQHCSIRDSW